MSDLDSGIRARLDPRSVETVRGAMFEIGHHGDRKLAAVEAVLAGVLIDVGRSVDRALGVPDQNGDHDG